MTKWGLAGAGSVSRSFLPRVAGLRGKLGPVASTSYRLAARIANSIRAGGPARDFRELDACGLILLCAPGGTLARLTDAVRSAELDWGGKTLLILDSDSYSSDFAEFRTSGASIASVHAVEVLANRYVIEGDRDALRHAKLLVRDLGGKPIEIPGDRVRFYDASRTLAGSLFTPLIETCVECIRQAGITGPASAALAEALLQRSLRAFMHAGRKSWSGPIARADREAINRECLELTARKPLMGRYFQNSADFAFDLYKTFPELTRYNRARWEMPERE